MQRFTITFDGIEIDDVKEYIEDQGGKVYSSSTEDHYEDEADDSNEGESED